MDLADAHHAPLTLQRKPDAEPADAAVGSSLTLAPRASRAVPGDEVAKQPRVRRAAKESHFAAHTHFYLTNLNVLDGSRGVIPDVVANASTMVRLAAKPPLNCPLPRSGQTQ